MNLKTIWNLLNPAVISSVLKPGEWHEIQFRFVLKNVTKS